MVNISNSVVQKLREKSPQRTSETWSPWIFVLCTDVFVESCLQKSDIGLTKKAATSPSSFTETPCRPSIPHLPPLSHWPSTDEHDANVHTFGVKDYLCRISTFEEEKKHGNSDYDGVSKPSWKFHIPQVHIKVKPRINTPTQKVQAIFFGSRWEKKPANTKVSSLVLKSFKPNIWNIPENHQTKNTPTLRILTELSFDLHDCSLSKRLLVVKFPTPKAFFHYMMPCATSQQTACLPEKDNHPLTPPGLSTLS